MKEEDLSPFVGTWKVTEMGVYQISSCSGEVDDTEWRGLKGKGLTITLEINKDGTGVETITGPNPEVTTFAWYDVGETFCFKEDCYPYTMSNDKRSFHINIVSDPYCIDENFEITGHSNQRECESASSSNAWIPKKCQKIKYKKQI
tara:strand:- start:122 stop:559 length:438 start_codon:yes stop_codon:yes gene_type:complete